MANATPWLKEVLIHSTDSSCILPSDLLSIKRNTSVLLATSDTLIGQNPTSGQLSFAVQLEPNIIAWKLSGCQFKASTFYQLVAMSNYVSELDITGCSLGLCELQELKHYSEKENCFANLIALNISNIKVTSHQGAIDMAKILSNATKLKDVTLNNNILVAASTRLKGLSLTKLNLSFNTINGNTARDIAILLSQNTELNELIINSCDLEAKIATTIFKGIIKLLYLTKLNISNSIISNEAADNLGVILCQNNLLEKLELSYNYIQTAGAMKMFNKMDSIFHLSVLTISHNNLTDEAANGLTEVLSHNFGLRELDLSYNYLQAAGIAIICKGLRNLAGLMKLNISNNNIGSKAAHDIAVVLSHNSSLEELDLGYNNLGASGALQIFLSMKSFTSLIKLNIGSIGMTDFAADNLVNILNNNVNLKELDLSHNCIQVNGAIRIFNNATMFRLNKLNISYNNITDQAADDIASFITYNSELKILDLCHNNLQTSGTIKICKTNISKLINLNISHNNITKDAADSIATFLTHNNKLQVLDLSYNELGCKDIFKSIQTLSVLKLSNCHFINETTRKLAIILQYNTELKEIDLSHNDLSTQVIIKIFAEGMKNISGLETINISHNMITYEAAKYIATVLSHNTKLKQLYLSHNKLSALGAIKIFKGLTNISNLISLYISHNMITDEAANDTVTFLLHNTDLKELDLSHNNLSTVGVIKICTGMRNISKLRMLNISHNKISDEAADDIAKVLSHNSNLQTLDISSNYLTSVCFAKILHQTKNMICLMKLDISCNKITIDNNATFNSKPEEFNRVDHTTRAAKVISMESISSLKDMNFSNILITGVVLDNLAAVLSQNTKIEVLDISNNNLQTSGTIKIFQNITHITTLTKLNIAHNMIDDDATEYIGTVLSNCSELVEINISNNNFYTLNILDCLMFSNLIKVNFSNNNISEHTLSEFSDFLSSCTKLEELNLSNTNLQTAGAIKLFKNLTCFTLKIINISGNCIAETAANHIALSLSKNNKLQEIDVSCNALYSSGISNILASINITSLTKLNISSNVSISFNLIGRYLVHATKLVALDLSYNKLEKGSFDDFFIGISTLKMLNLKNTGITDKTALALVFVLSGNENLQELDLSYNDVHAEGISSIFRRLNISHLTKINISNNAIDEQGADDIGNFLSNNINLEELDVSCNNLHGSGIIKLCKRLTNLSKLTKLKIGGNHFTHYAADNVAELLLLNSKLEVVDLSNNDLLLAGITSISNSMKNLLTLTSVNISYNWITSEAATDIASVLSQNIYMKELYLANNYLESNGTITLCKGLSNILYLTHLDMSCNKITDVAAHDIAILLFHNLELEEIDLSNNLIQAPGATKIFSAILAHSNLKKLIICKNAITDKAVDAMAQFLSQSTKLKEFDVSSNYLQAVGAVKIFGAIKSTNLVKLNMNNNMINDDAADGIMAILSTVTKLKEVNLNNNKMSHFTVNNLIDECSSMNTKLILHL